LAFKGIGILLKKLSKMGIVGKAHDWFTSYLQGRSQCVDIGGSLSEFLDLDISVIQGMHLGPPAVLVLYK
jgi:hypothetical protein